MRAKVVTRYKSVKHLAMATMKIGTCILHFVALTFLFPCLCTDVNAQGSNANSTFKQNKYRFVVYSKVPLVHYATRKWGAWREKVLPFVIDFYQHPKTEIFVSLIKTVSRSTKVRRIVTRKAMATKLAKKTTFKKMQTLTCRQSSEGCAISHTLWLTCSDMPTSLSTCSFTWFVRGLCFGVGELLVCSQSARLKTSLSSGYTHVARVLVPFGAWKRFCTHPRETFSGQIGMCYL